MSKSTIYMIAGMACISSGLALIHIGLCLTFLGVMLIFGSYMEYEEENDESED